jgi:hypothetical protein
MFYALMGAQPAASELSSELRLRLSQLVRAVLRGRQPQASPASISARFRWASEQWPPAAEVLRSLDGLLQGPVRGRGNQLETPPEPVAPASAAEELFHQALLWAMHTEHPDAGVDTETVLLSDDHKAVVAQDVWFRRFATLALAHFLCEADPAFAKQVDRERLAVALHVRMGFSTEARESQMSRKKKEEGKKNEKKKREAEEGDVKLSTTEISFDFIPSSSAISFAFFFFGVGCFRHH